MAHIIRATTDPLKDKEKSQHFHRAMELNFSFGADCLRKLTEKYLRDKGVNLKEHLDESSVKKVIGKLHLFPDQKQILHDSNPNLHSMDITLLNILLLRTFPNQMTNNDRNYIEHINDKRTELSHSAKAELPDDSFFNEYSQIILALSKSIDRKYHQDMINSVNELRRRELVRTCCNVDRVKINIEVYMLKLVDSTPEEAEQDKELLIKFGLTKWVRRLTIGLEVSEFLKLLRSEGVITDTEKRTFELEYSYEGQMRLLILHIVQTGTKDALYKMIYHLRQVSPVLADLVEGSDTNGREIEQFLADKATGKIRNVLVDAVVERSDEFITSEDIHIYIEQTLKDRFEYKLVRTCLLKEFPRVKNSLEDSSFSGITWKEHLASRFIKCQTIPEKQVTDFQEMSCEEFAEYAGRLFKKRRASLGDIFKTAIFEESLSATTFTNMTNDQLKNTFMPYLGSIKFGAGIEMDLQNLQRSIRDSATRENIFNETQTEILRTFEKPAGKKKYQKNIVRPPAGNLIIPQHAFVHFPSGQEYNTHFIVKEVVRFTAACINGRKNGTIHFGIETLQNGVGRVIGIQVDRKILVNLDDEIDRSLTVCFQEKTYFAKRCVRPVQVVPVEDGTVVIEIDIVPYSVFLSTDMLPVLYPPKGCQSEKYFIYDVNEILLVSPSKLNEVNKACAKILDERKHQEGEQSVNEEKDNRIQRKLKQLLTRGNRYVKDELLPIIVLGRISRSQNESEIRNALDIDRAVTSAELVLDFDSSVEHLNKVEKNKTSFLIKTAENLSKSSMQRNDVTDFTETLPIWLYCNGYNGNGNSDMQMSDWMRERSDGVKRQLNHLRQSIPKGRGIVIFLVFDVPSHSQEPLFEIARECLISLYRDECIVITDNEENVVYLKQEVERMYGKPSVDTCFITGLNWVEISRVINTVFRISADVVCKLPCSKGHFVEMTLKEKNELKLTDIDILSGEQCLHEEELMQEGDRRTNRRESQEQFYRGKNVTWWNFYYKNQVGKRDLFTSHRREIEVKLSNEKGEGLIEVQEIEHHPGAGGSTLGRHLIWKFSQFKGEPDSAYRCLVVKSITEKTVNQIDRFRTFKDEDDTRPFILLVDNKSEEDVILLRTKLHELAYKTATPNKLFCLIIIVSRMSITYVNTKGKHLLKHQLSTRERNWFEDKYKEMEKTGDIDVKTLIAFNFMRNAFNEKYIQDTTCRLMLGISKKELDVLKCLSLICTYECDHPVPQNVFDSLMKDQFDIEIITRQPFGIAHHMKELARLRKFKCKTWNVELSDAMQLLITKHETENIYEGGVGIVSQLLARAILGYIMKQEEISLANIVDYVLDLLEEQSKLENRMSKKFVKIVCSLFKTRQLIDSEKSEAKLKFSDLILELEGPIGSEDEADAKETILRLMQRCFDITDDAMVGQQLARFNIHIKEYTEAERAIQRSLEKRPQSSYLLDTYGQIFKAKMEFLQDSSPLCENKIPDENAASIIEEALKAIQKFKEGQLLAIQYDEDTNWSCFRMEVKTMLNLLEKFSKFSCYGNRENFLSFLNKNEFKLEGSSFFRIMELCPSLDYIRSGRDFQQHVDTSLRSLEERFYQVKGHLYTVFTENEALLLKLRERFERYYGSPGKTAHYKFLYGIGLKPLQQAKEKKPETLEQRVREAEYNLQHKRLSEVDERDLLVYLGTKIISLTNQPEGTEECQNNDYRKLLSYTNRLVHKQLTVKKAERLYLESFLYFAMLHWPLQCRTTLNLEELSGPANYVQLMEKWESAFCNNFFLNTTEQMKKHKPKNYFALAKGSPGNDIIDLESVRKEWVQKEKDKGRLRKPVYRDNFWKEAFVVEKLRRLDGIMDESGNNILHKTEYPQHGTHTFKINTYYPCIAYSNRAVTFVLGFTWKGLTALDVDEKDSKDGKYSHRPVDIDEELSSLEVEENVDELNNSQKGATRTKQSRGLAADDRVATGGEQMRTGVSKGDKGATVSSQKVDIDEELISVETEENYDKLDRSKKGATKSKHSRGLTAVDNVVTEQQPNTTEEKQLHIYASKADEGAAASGVSSTASTPHDEKHTKKRPVWMKPKKRKHRKK